MYGTRTMDPKVALATIALTLKETGGGPKSMLWLPFSDGKLTLDKFNVIMEILKEMGICTVTSEYVKFTPPAAGTKADTMLKGIEAVFAGAKGGA